MKHAASLVQNRDFLRLYKRGKSAVHPVLVTYVAPNRLGVVRVGITTSKKIGNAVARNRARRIIRAAWRQLEPRLSVGWDVVFVARGQTPRSTMPQILPAMTKHLTRLGALPADIGSCEE